VAVGTVRWRIGGVQRLSVVVKATFGFVHDGTARLLPPLDVVREDHLHEGLLDLAAETAPYLPSAGVVLTGHARAPHGQPARSLAVRLGVYRDAPLIDKTLHVFGERAQPFRKLRLGWDRAARGDDNPAGSSVPCIVDPAHPGRPAGFGPIPPPWPARKRRLGALDIHHVVGPAALELPEGIDFRFFHAAPPDQQIDFLEGDEWIVLDGMHATLGRTRTRLPGARAEARWYTAARGSAPGQPIPLEADTLIIDADQLRCSVIWRGSVGLSEQPSRVEAGLSLPGYPVAWPASQAEALRSARITAPPPGAPAPSPSDEDEHDATQAVVITATDRAALPFFFTPASPETGPRAAPSVVPPAPAPLENVLPFRPAGATAVAVPAAPKAPWREQLATLAEGLDEDDDHTAAVDFRHVHAGVLAPFAVAAPRTTPASPAAPLPGAPWSTPAEPPPAVDEECASTVLLGKKPAPPPPRVELVAPVVAPPAFVAPPPATAVPPPLVGEPPDVPEARAVDREPEPAPPPPVAAPPAPPAPPAAPAPKAEPPALVVPSIPDSPLRDKVVAALAAHEALRGLDLQNADLRGIDFRGASMASCRLGGADLTGCVLADARLADADLTGARLGKADLTGADLTRADLSRANLAGATLAGANLADAVLTGAQGQGASFAGARAPRATFARGAWDGAVFELIEALAADFTSAVLDGARFDGATLGELCLDDAQGAGASFEGARLPGARADSAAFPRASFKGAEAPGSIWEQATLDEASFAEADLQGATFNRASAPGASFAGARLGGANLGRLRAEGADLRRAVLEGADLRAARLVGASLEGADLRNIVAQKADLSRARLDGARLEGANLRHARLTSASLVGADLASADLRDADLERADLTGASRRTAKMNGANLKDVIGAGES
jgi:uncharacterized protein YjbI with pentapeptide repeats